MSDSEDDAELEEKAPDEPPPRRRPSPYARWEGETFEGWLERVCQ